MSGRFKSFGDNDDDYSDDEPEEEVQRAPPRRARGGVSWNNRSGDRPVTRQPQPEGDRYEGLGVRDRREESHARPATRAGGSDRTREREGRVPLDKFTPGSLPPRNRSSGRGSATPGQHNDEQLTMGTSDSSFEFIRRHNKGGVAWRPSSVTVYPYEFEIDVFYTVAMPSSKDTVLRAVDYTTIKHAVKKALLTRYSNRDADNELMADVIPKVNDAQVYSVEVVSMSNECNFPVVASLKDHAALNAMVDAQSGVSGIYAVGARQSVEPHVMRDLSSYFRSPEQNLLGRYSSKSAVLADRELVHGNMAKIRKDSLLWAIAATFDGYRDKWQQAMIDSSDSDPYVYDIPSRWWPKFEEAALAYLGVKLRIARLFPEGSNSTTCLSAMFTPSGVSSGYGISSSNTNQVTLTLRIIGCLPVMQNHARWEAKFMTRLKGQGSLALKRSAPTFLFLKDGLGDSHYDLAARIRENTKKSEEPESVASE